ncbi:MAG: MBL fold metallo-hydrolase [Candidatus Thermoplasmatota archaeon]
MHDLLVWSLASGSNGNALLMGSGETLLLIDDGISTKRLRQHLAALDLTPHHIDAIAITHEHHDHVSGLPVLRKHTDAPILASRGTARALGLEHYERLAPDRGFRLKDLTITPFLLPHDAEEPLGLAVESGGRKALVATDLGHATDRLMALAGNCDVLVIEANHDIGMLMNGSYPAVLKARILGPYGHLSNPEAGEIAAHAVHHGTRHVMLSHLSMENNDPIIAMETVQRELRRRGVAQRITISPRGMPGEMLRLEPPGKPL